MSTFIKMYDWLGYEFRVNLCQVVHLCRYSPTHNELATARGCVMLDQEQARILATYLDDTRFDPHDEMSVLHHTVDLRPPHLVERAESNTKGNT